MATTIDDLLETPIPTLPYIVRRREGVEDKDFIRINRCPKCYSYLIYLWNFFEGQEPALNCINTNCDFIIKMSDLETED